MVTTPASPAPSGCYIRTSYPPPTHADGGLAGGATASGTGRISHIQFRHPGYPDTGNTNIMLILPALDYSSSESSGRFGLHHETARLACAIVANCAWDGFLSTEKHRDAAPITTAPDELLTATRYYFHVRAHAGDDDDDSLDDDDVIWSQRGRKRARYDLSTSLSSFESWRGDIRGEIKRLDL